MRFTTFNVLHGRAVADGRAVAGPAGEAPAGEALATAVASLDADVLALQELDRLQQRSGLADQPLVAAKALGAAQWRYASALHGCPAPGRGWAPDPRVPGLRVYGPDGAAPGDVPSHGIALLTRLPVRDWRVRRLAPAPVGMPLRVVGRAGLTMVRDQPRAALAAVVEGRRGPFTVAAVHLSFVPGWNVRQLAAVRRWIADLPRPQLLLGDLNLVGALPQLVLSAAVTAAGRSSSGRPLPGWRDLARARTYPSHRPVVQFDRLLATGIPRDAVRAVSTPVTPISDHRPLVVDLALDLFGP